MFANDTKATKQKNLYGLNFAFILSSRLDQTFQKICYNAFDIHLNEKVFKWKSEGSKHKTLKAMCFISLNDFP